MLTYLALHLDSGQLAELRDLFVKIDTDHSGVISYDELHDALLEVGLIDAQGYATPTAGSSGPTPGFESGDAASGGGGGGGGGAGSSAVAGSAAAKATGPKLSEIFRHLDEDNSGTIQYSEFLAATVQMQINLDEESLMGIFRKLDVSKTNDISLDDLEKALGSMFSKEHIKELFSRADVDKVRRRKKKRRGGSGARGGSRGVGGSPDQRSGVGRGTGRQKEQDSGIGVAAVGLLCRRALPCSVIWPRRRRFYRQ